MPERERILEVSDLSVSFATENGRAKVIEEVSFSVARGGTLGLVGESGCGKSVTAMSIMRLLPSPPSRVDAGRILFDGMDLLVLSKTAIRAVRGNRIGMIFQEPMTSLNPTFSIGFQIGEVLRLHRNLNLSRSRDRCVELLEMVGVGSAATRVDQYPHQLSGGLRQRVMIAMAIACGPRLLIADEPTTALDVTIQAQILELLARLQRELHMSILLITHDLGVVAEFCDHVVVMYAGRIVEKASVEQIFANPRHPYTRGLLTSVPQIGRKRTHLPTIPGMVPDIEQRPAGCYFAERCDRVQDICFRNIPRLDGRGTENRLACWNPYGN
ncbi:MAG: ABC transporter ATP-binding protein [Desulfobacterales bacterium]|nr:MAG: ABC transporter ATP-binding protein [Desulfobacterales bacterium]